jgi:hypothetical protein
MNTRLIRANVEAFLKQEGGSTTALMPVLPKLLLLMLDEIERLELRCVDGSADPA